MFYVIYILRFNTSFLFLKCIILSLVKYNNKIDITTQFFKTKIYF